MSEIAPSTQDSAFGLAGTRGRIGLALDYFMQWIGGVAFSHSFSDALLRAAPLCQTEVCLIFTVPPAVAAKLPNGVAAFPRAELRAEGPLGVFLNTTSCREIYLARDLETAARNLDLDVIGPTGIDLGRRFPIPWCAYLWDFQHRHLPQFFSEQERTQRDALFAHLVGNSRTVLVNSQSVVADIQRFFTPAEIRADVRRFPTLIPTLDAAPAEESEARRLFRLEGPYVICCSQQWIHKQHELIIRAFHRALAEGIGPDVSLVFTGTQGDYRVPEHRAQIDALIRGLGLESRVRYLGVIERRLQLALIRHAAVMVQASLFEGGPGASGTAEAVTLGTPVLASNIMANREIAFGHVEYFAPTDLEALCELLVARLGRPVRSDPVSPDEAAAVNLAAGIQLSHLLLRDAASPE